MPFPTTSEGAFELTFKTEKSFARFGKEYLKCYANLAVKGELSAPENAGSLDYKIDFSLACGCQSVLGEFKKAYDKTFPPPPTAQAAEQDRDWTGDMLLCKVVASTPATMTPHRGFTSRLPLAQADSASTPLAADLPGQPWLDGYALGKGVNAVTGALSAQAIDSFTVTPATSTNATAAYASVYSASDVDTLINVSASGSYNMDGVTANASASYLSQVKESALDLTILATYQVEYNDYDTINSSSVQLSASAKQYLDQGQFAAFRNLYGDYYLAGTKRQATFRAVYTVSAESAEALMNVKASLGASAPAMFTAQGQAEFNSATSSSNVSVNFYLDMQGMPANAPNHPTAPIGITTVQEYLQWFQTYNAPVPIQAEMIHYSQLDSRIPTTLPIDPNVFVAVGSLYFNTYVLKVALNSLPANWQGTYPSQVNALVMSVAANQQTLVSDPTTLSSLTAQVNQLNAALNNLTQRYLFLQAIQALQTSEPGVGSHQSQTQTFGSVSYPNAANDPDFVIQYAYQNDAEGGHIGHRNHDFDLTPGGIIVQWELHQVWSDGTDGDWWKNNQANNSSYILLNTSASVHCESEYDRGFDNTLSVWYVDASLVPGPVAGATEQQAAARPEAVLQ